MLAPGTPRAILVRRTVGDFLELGENGSLLGPFLNASRANICAPFNCGDRLVLYTDGIVETVFTDGEPFGLRRLREFFAALSDSGPGALADALISAVVIGAQEDDLTVVVEAC